MTYATILLHMGDDPQHAARLRFALGLARRFGAHLDVVHVLTPTTLPVAGRGASAAFLAEAVAAERERAAGIARNLRERCQDIKLTYHAVEGDAVDRLAERSVLADLVLVGERAVSAFEDRFSPQTSDRLPDVAACPTLVQPATFEGDDAGRRPLVAWTPSRAAARALHDALPFLMSSQAPVVACGGRDGDGPVDVDGLRTYLARHGVAAEIHPTPYSTGEAGAAILDLAKRQGCDMIVMGAYGHARWREILFGGATRHVLMQSPVPVLVSR
jgi:nucleotide-binding universal stress UspA family protein